MSYSPKQCLAISPLPNLPTFMYWLSFIDSHDQLLDNRHHNSNKRFLWNKNQTCRTLHLDEQIIFFNSAEKVLNFDGSKPRIRSVLPLENRRLLDCHQFERGILVGSCCLPIHCTSLTFSVVNEASVLYFTAAYKASETKQSHAFNSRKHCIYYGEK